MAHRLGGMKDCTGRAAEDEEKILNHRKSWNAAAWG
jgi:hypothetical protein